MEKSLFEIVLLPVLGMIGWQERTKVGRRECDKTHKGVCDKLNLIHDDVKYMKERLDKHLEK
jgi:hemerythrin